MSKDKLLFQNPMSTLLMTLLPVFSASFLGACAVGTHQASLTAKNAKPEGSNPSGSIGGGSDTGGDSSSDGDPPDANPPEDEENEEDENDLSGGDTSDGETDGGETGNGETGDGDTADGDTDGGTQDGGGGGESAGETTGDDGASGVPGSLDFNFGTDGKYVGFSIDNYNSYTHVGVQNFAGENKTLLAGMEGGQVSIVRLDQNGILEPLGHPSSFNLDQSLTTSVELVHMEVLEDNSVVVGGHRTNTNQIRFVRYLPNGDLDSNFSSGQHPGIVDLNTEEGGVHADLSNFRLAHFVTRYSQIFAVGTAFSSASNNHVIFIVKINYFGQVDTGFGTEEHNRFVILDWEDREDFGSRIDFVKSGAENLIVAGTSTLECDPDDLCLGPLEKSVALARLDIISGSPLTSFGEDGKMLVNFDSHSFSSATDLVVDKSSIFLAARGGPPLIAKLNLAGIVSSTFGTGSGYTELPTGFKLENLIQKENGSFLATGTENGQFSVHWLTSSGSKDLSYGPNGWTGFQMQNGASDRSYGAAISSDGLILLGSSTSGETSRIAACRVVL